MTTNFWAELPKPFYFSTNGRCDRCSVPPCCADSRAPDVFFTEFTNSDSYCHPDGIESVRGRLTFTEDEQPIVAHIWETSRNFSGK